MKKQVMYLGERVLPLMGKPRQAFRIRGEDEVRYFAGIKHVWFGAVYEAEVDGENITLKVRPETVESDWEPSNADRLEYETQKLICSEYRARQRKIMEIKKPHKDIQRAADLLRPFFRDLSEHDRNRFMSWFRNEVSRRKK